LKRGKPIVLTLETTLGEVRIDASPPLHHLTSWPLFDHLKRQRNRFYSDCSFYFSLHLPFPTLSEWSKALLVSLKPYYILFLIMLRTETYLCWMENNLIHNGQVKREAGEARNKKASRKVLHASAASRRSKSGHEAR
jgi:hypothetical protein